MAARAAPAGSRGRGGPAGRVRSRRATARRGGDAARVALPSRAGRAIDRGGRTGMRLDCNAARGHRNRSALTRCRWSDRRSGGDRQGSARRAVGGRIGGPERGSPCGVESPEARRTWRRGDVGRPLHRCVRPHAIARIGRSGAGQEGRCRHPDALRHLAGVRGSPAVAGAGRAGSAVEVELGRLERRRDAGGPGGGRGCRGRGSRRGRPASRGRAPGWPRPRGSPARGAGPGGGPAGPAASPSRRSRPARPRNR